MDIRTYKKEIEQCIFPGDNIEKALKRLLEILRDDSPFRKEVFNIAGRFADLKRDSRKGVIDRTTSNLEKNQVRDSILEINSSLDFKDLKEGIELAEGIFEKILVVCTENHQAFFQGYLSDRYFKNISFLINYQQIPEDLNNYDIVLFDFDEKSNLDESRLTEFLEASTSYFLVLVYRQLDLIRNEKYRDRIQAANSGISLIARLQELVTFIQYVGKKK